MRTGLSQHTSMRQELRVNPRLYQAMDMLYMPMMDLQQHLKQELLANPFLELLEPEDETPEQKDAEQEKEQKEKEEEMDWEEILLNGFEVGGTREQYEQLEYTEPVTVETKDLIDYLREQLQMMTLTPRQLLLAEEFLGNINDEGYLAASLEEILGSVNQLVAGHVSGEEGEGEEGGDVGEPLEGKDRPGGDARPRRRSTPSPKPKRCSPSSSGSIRRASAPGTCASASSSSSASRPTPNRSPSGWSMTRSPTSSRTAGTISPSASASSRPRSSRRRTSWRGWTPSPASSTRARATATSSRTSSSRRSASRYQVFLNDTGMPRLRLSRSYQEIARDKKKMTPENREFIASKMNSANWMIQAIEQRRQTMLKVMNFIVDRQREFFEKGIEHLAPADPPGSGGGDQHARIDREPGDQREVRADSPRRATAQVLLLERARHRLG